MIVYSVGSSGEVIQFSDAVVAHLLSHRQTRFWHREAGGLLFARFIDKRIIVEEATGPRRTDRRSRYAYSPDRRAEQVEIDTRYKNGLHYVGDWHSHPEARPTPSGRDEQTMASRVLMSQHQLNGFLFAIIGLAPLPDGLVAVIHDGFKWYPLTQMPADALP